MGQTKSSVFQRGKIRTEIRQSPCIGSTSHNVAAKNAKHATHMCIDTVLRQEYSQYGVYHTAFAFRDRVSCSFCGIVACKFGDFYGYSQSPLFVFRPFCAKPFMSYKIPLYTNYRDARSIPSIECSARARRSFCGVSLLWCYLSFNIPLMRPEGPWQRRYIGFLHGRFSLSQAEITGRSSLLPPSTARKRIWKGKNKGKIHSRAGPARPAAVVVCVCNPYIYPAPSYSRPWRQLVLLFLYNMTDSCPRPAIRRGALGIPPSQWGSLFSCAHVHAAAVVLLTAALPIVAGLWRTDSSLPQHHP